MFFGQTLLQLRHQKGVRQKRIALALGVDQSFISSIESGKKSPPKDGRFVEIIAKELGLSAAEKDELERSISVERCLGPMAQGATLAQAALGMAVIQQLPTLGPAKIQAIEAILHLENA